MAAEPTTPCDRSHARWGRVARLVVLGAVAAVPFVTSGSTAAGQEVAPESSGLAVEADRTAIDVEPHTHRAVPELRSAPRVEASGDGEAAAGSGDSGLSGWAQLGILAAVAVVFLAVFGRRVVAVIDRRTVSWLDAWVKTLVIVVALVVSIVIVPAKVLELGAVQDMSRAAQDLITLGLWSGALAVSLLVLWYAHRERRI